MKFLLMFIVLCFANVSYGQFETVALDSLEPVTIEMKSSILAQVQIDLPYKLVSESMIQKSMIQKSMIQKRILFRGDRGGRLREFIKRLFNRSERSNSMS